MNKSESLEIENRLMKILSELKVQDSVASSYDSHALSFADEMEQLHEYLKVGEYEIAYETIVAALEKHPFVLSGQGAVALLELGLTLGYKTDRKEDEFFDRR